MTQLALARLKPRRGDEPEDAVRVRRLAMAALSSSRQADPQAS